MHKTILKIQSTAIAAQTELIIEKHKNLSLNNRLNASMLCLLKIRETYPHIYHECLSENDIKGVLSPRGSERRAY